jgi:hypothetical protein
MSEDLRRHSRAGVPDGQGGHRVFLFTGEGDRDAPSRSGVFPGVRQQVAHCLGEPHRVAVDHEGPVREVELQTQSPGFEVPAMVVHHCRHQRPKVYHAFPKHDPPAADELDIEEVADQPCEVRDLPVEGRKSLGPDGRITSGGLQKAETGTDGGQGISQFVAEDCEKPVLSGARSP